MNQKIKAALVRLAQRIDSRTREGKVLITQIPGLALVKRVAPMPLIGKVREPLFCLVPQGTNRITLGERTCDCSQDQYLLTSMDMPMVGHILDASREQPYLGLMLKIDTRQAARMIADHRQLTLPLLPGAETDVPVGRISVKLMDTVCRLMDLLDEPSDIPVLGPMVQREILYRLLTGPQGPRLRQMATAGTRNHQIFKTISWLKENYRKSVRLEDLAAMAGMSPSSFHAHFKKLTDMTPLQFQKKLRLNQARKLMLAENLDAASASFAVGYESPSQFNREYRRFFGATPIKDIKALTRVPFQ